MTSWSQEAAGKAVDAKAEYRQLMHAPDRAVDIDFINEINSPSQAKQAAKPRLHGKGIPAATNTQIGVLLAESPEVDEKLPVPSEANAAMLPAIRKISSFQVAADTTSEAQHRAEGAFHHEPWVSYGSIEMMQQPAEGPQNVEPSSKADAGHALAFNNLAEGIQHTASPTNRTSSAGDQLSKVIRLVACTLMKNEVPYVVEWIEFHRLMGFSHIAIWDDGSEDNAHLIERLYTQHGRTYVSYDRQPEYTGSDDFETQGRMRRVEAAKSCLLKYKHLADWIIHLDIDEFVWSPRHKDLRTFFQTGVPADRHILYAGATRFGWEHMRHRHTYALQEVSLSNNLQENLHCTCLLQLR